MGWSQRTERTERWAKGSFETPKVVYEETGRARRDVVAQDDRSCVDPTLSDEVAGGGTLFPERCTTLLIFVYSKTEVLVSSLETPVGRPGRRPSGVPPLYLPVDRGRG